MNVLKYLSHSLEITQPKVTGRILQMILPT